jgi:hypothetical protein
VRVGRDTWILAPTLPRGTVGLDGYIVAEQYFLEGRITASELRHIQDQVAPEFLGRKSGFNEVVSQAFASADKSHFGHRHKLIPFDWGSASLWQADGERTSPGNTAVAEEFATSTSEVGESRSTPPSTPEKGEGAEENADAASESTATQSTAARRRHSPRKFDPHRPATSGDRHARKRIKDRSNTDPSAASSETVSMGEGSQSGGKLTKNALKRQERRANAAKLVEEVDKQAD